MCKIEIDLKRRWEVFCSGQFQIRLKIKQSQREKIHRFRRNIARKCRSLGRNNSKQYDKLRFRPLDLFTV